MYSMCTISVYYYYDYYDLCPLCNQLMSNFQQKQQIKNCYLKWCLVSLIAPVTSVVCT